MDTILRQIQIPDVRIGTRVLVRLFGVTRQTAIRWCSLGLFKTAKLEHLAGRSSWIVDLWEVLLFHTPDLGCKSKAQRAEFAAPSLSEAQIREYLDGLEVE